MFSVLITFGAAISLSGSSGCSCMRHSIAPGVASSTNRSRLPFTPVSLSSRVKPFFSKPFFTAAASKAPVSSRWSTAWPASIMMKRHSGRVAIIALRRSIARRSGVPASCTAGAPHFEQAVANINTSAASTAAPP
ncbi:MAG: hypothetical protein QM723_24230 [Myxococcaceae bacterium]